MRNQTYDLGRSVSSAHLYSGARQAGGDTCLLRGASRLQSGRGLALEAKIPNSGTSGQCSMHWQKEKASAQIFPLLPTWLAGFPPPQRRKAVIAAGGSDPVASERPWPFGTRKRSHWEASSNLPIQDGQSLFHQAGRERHDSGSPLPQSWKRKPLILKT